MAYTPNVPAWADATGITYGRLNNMETQYAEGYTYYAAHNHDSDYYTRTWMETIVLTPGSEQGFWYAGNDGSGSGCDGDTIYTSGGNLHFDDLAVAGAPDGVIVLWAGSVGSIPNAEDWYLCDGTNGTIDLTNKWVVGAGSTFSVGGTGGSTTCTSIDTLNIGDHAITTAEMPSHRHVWTDYYPTIYPFAGSGGLYYSHGSDPITHNGTTGSNTSTESVHTHTGTCTTTATENRPPSKAYCYIQKVVP